MWKIPLYMTDFTSIKRLIIFTYSSYSFISIVIAVIIYYIGLVYELWLLQYVIFLSVVLLCHKTYGSSTTIFSPSTKYAVEQTVARNTFIVVWFRKLFSLYFFLLNLIHYWTQRLSLSKIITNTRNSRPIKSNRNK